MGKWAEAEGRGDEFHQQVFRAYFVDGLNIARTEVLKIAALAAGLDADVGLANLRKGQYRQAVDIDWQRAHRLGISAVPTFLINGRKLTGAQPYSNLKEFVANALV